MHGIDKCSVGGRTTCDTCTGCECCTNGKHEDDCPRGDLDELLTAARAEIEEAKAAAVADNGETWESECMRARAQRDEARVEIESERTKVGVLIDDLKRTGQRYEDALTEIERLREALGEAEADLACATRYRIAGSAGVATVIYVTGSCSIYWRADGATEGYYVEDGAELSRADAIAKARALAKGST